MLRSGLLCLLVVVVLPTSVFAQVGRDVAERASNRGQISQGQQALERDQQELQRFSQQLGSLEQAVAAGDDAAANAALAALGPLVQTEVGQAGAKAESARREVAGGMSETGSNRRESRRNRDDSDAFGRTDDDALDAGRDAMNRMDDVRDVSDEKRDLEAAVARAQRQQQLAQGLTKQPLSLGNAAGREQAAAQVALLKEFEQLMRQDLTATEQEIAEDRREAGEDRRETRDDLREADELDNRMRRETGNMGRRGR